MPWLLLWGAKQLDHWHSVTASIFLDPNHFFSPSQW